MSIGKFRPATQANVGKVPVTELDEKDSKVLEESLMNPEPVKEEYKPAKTKVLVNIRKMPDILSDVVKILPADTDIEVKSSNTKDWYEVRLGQMAYYIRKEYVILK